MKTAIVSLILTLASPLAFAHEHLEAGAASTDPGTPLEFVNADEYDADSGYVFGLTAGTPEDAYDGYYYTGDLVFAALAATPPYGGPEPNAAALGAHIAVLLESIEGPAGGSFGFWETEVDDVDSTNLTWSVDVGLVNGTNRIDVSENDGSPGSDPYGHKHGRIYSVTVPGLYRIGFRFVDTSTNGPNGGPIQAPSELYTLNLQADLTLSIAPSTNAVAVTFAAPSNLPDSGVGPATNYTVESSPTLDATANWQAASDVVVGDDHMHTVTLPLTAGTRFFRLRTD